MGDVKLAAFLGAGLGARSSSRSSSASSPRSSPPSRSSSDGGKAARSQAIPLGPFLALGAVIALFAGDAILDWYVELGG